MQVSKDTSSSHWLHTVTFTVLCMKVRCRLNYILPAELVPEMTLKVMFENRRKRPLWGISRLLELAKMLLFDDRSMETIVIFFTGIVDCFIDIKTRPKFYSPDLSSGSMLGPMQNS